MPLEPYQRGPVWWAKGRVEINGRPISDYIRESTGSSTESGAWDWIDERTAFERRRHYIGEESTPDVFTFADAVMLYDPDPDTAKYLRPILEEFGETECKAITAGMIRDFARRKYPKNSTDSWRRWVITPARAVINNANDLGKCPPIKIKGFTSEERIEQDKDRNKRSRVAKRPGDWEWLLKFCQHADPRLKGLALLMFTTGARIGQAVAMTPAHLKLDENKVIIPGAKGHDDRELVVPAFLVDALKAIKPKAPRGWDGRFKENLRVFGYASKDGPGAAWDAAVKAAKIERLTPHAAGRHGFGQEMRVRRSVDKKAVEAFGGWSATGDMVDKTYTHAEDHTDKIHRAARTGLVQARRKTGLKL